MTSATLHQKLLKAVSLQIPLSEIGNFVGQAPMYNTSQADSHPQTSMAIDPEFRSCPPKFNLQSDEIAYWSWSPDSNRVMGICWRKSNSAKIFYGILAANPEIA